jgi:5-hydroxyisourate hydrolase
MSRITTHVLDTVLGKPAAGIALRLERREGETWVTAANGVTDKDGRSGELATDAASGTYRLIFSTGPYFAGSGRHSLYPEICITFACATEAHYHLPLLLSDNSYTTYRGS